MSDTATLETIEDKVALKRLGNAELHYSSAAMYGYNGRIPVHALGGVAHTLQKVLSLCNTPQRIVMDIQRIGDAQGDISIGRIKRIVFECPTSLIGMITTRARAQGVTLEDAQLQIVRTILEVLHKGNTKSIHMFGVNVQCL